MTENITPADSAEGRTIALLALKRMAQRGSKQGRLAEETLERVVGIAWRYQFQPGDRRQARDDLRKALQPEVALRLGDDK